jgi:hypothetical protein
MRNLADIADLLETQVGLHRLLGHVESLSLPDCWIGAGFIRNAVWDVLHGRKIPDSRLNDVDVIFFDPADMGEEREFAIERRLQSLDPDLVWSVKNQARMHLRNGDRPYLDTYDAISHWPETATAVAARISHGHVEVIAPYGVEDLVRMIVRPTPIFRDKIIIYQERLQAKSWQTRWPSLTVLQDADGLPTDGSQP